MPPAAASSPGRAVASGSAIAAAARPSTGDVWRAVEAQHVVSTMALVDSLAEQAVLEDLLDAGKPPLPFATGHLAYLLFTPFRYPPPPGGSRFRGETDPGVFYAADEVRTACAELGYWRWRHLLDSPGMSAMPTRSQTVFRARIAARGVDLREPPFVASRDRWTDRDDYSACQAFARRARGASVGAIRYESVRDPARGGCCAVLDPAAFAKRVPLEQQTWTLSVLRDRVVWHRSHVVGGRAFEFLAADWTADGRRARRPPSRASRPPPRARRR